MPAITPSDLILLRGEGHHITTYASILKPRTLWSARVNNGASTNGDTAIIFDGGSGLDFSAIETFQEVWIGSVIGSNDIGRVRVRSVSSGDGGVTGTLTASPNSLNWVDNAFLTFLHDYPLKPKFPFIDSSGEFFKDSNEVYSDQNSQPSPVCVAGNHRAKFLSSGSAVFNVDLTNSYAIASGATISSYTTAVYPTTGVAVSVTAGVGTITFTAAGQFWVKFSCTDSNGKVQTTYRSYWVHSNVKTSSDYPFTDFSIGQLTGDWDRGGWECGINVTDKATLADIPDKTLIVIWGDWWFGTTNSPVTFLPDNDNALIVGYVRKYQTAHDLELGGESVDFSVTTAEAVLRQKYNFSVSQEAVNDLPDKWYEYEEWMTVGRTIHHYYKNHSSLFEIADVLGLLDVKTLRPYAEMEDGTLFATADSLSRDRGTRQHLVCDRGGIFRLVAESQLLPDSDRASLLNVAEILKTDRSGPITIVGEPENRVAFVHVSGFSWDGTFDADGKPNVNAICAIAPGDKPSDDGPSLRQVERQTFTDQTQANQIAGRVFAMENNYAREVRVNIHGNYLGVLEPCLGEYWTISLLATETPREIVWTDQKLYLRSVTAQFDHVAGRVSVTAVFEPEADGNDGKSTDCPTFPDFGGDFDIPAFDDQGGAIATAASFNYKPPSKKAWTQHKAGAMEHAWLDPFWVTTQNSFASKNAIVWGCGVGYVERSTDGGVNFTDVTPSTDPPNDSGDAVAPTVANVTFVQGEGSVINDQEHVVIARWQNATNDWRSWMAYTSDDGVTWSWSSIGGANSLATTSTFTGYTTFTDKLVTIKMSETRMLTTAVDDGGVLAVLYGVAGTVITEITSSSYGSAQVGVVTDMVRLTDTLALVSSFTNSTVQVYTIDISGDTITFNALLNITVNNGVNNGAVVARSDTTAVVFYRNLVGPSFSQLFAQKLNISTGTVALDGSASVVTTASVLNISARTLGVYQATELDDVLVTYRNIDDSGRMTAQKVSFNSFLASTAVVLDSVSASTTFSIMDGRKMLSPVSNGVSESKFVLAYISSVSTTLKVVVIDASAATPVVGTALSLVIDANDPSLDATQANKIYICYGSQDSFSVDGQRLRSVAVSGTTITDGNDEITLSTVGAGQNSSTIVLANANVFLSVTFGDDLFSYMVTTVGGDAKSLGLSLGKALSTTAYITSWLGSDQLSLSVITLPTLVLIANYSLGTATESELNADTYVAYPYAPFGIGDEFMYIFGRMNNPASLGTVHVIYSEDSGASFTAVESSWGSDHCGSLIEDFGTVFAIRNISGSSAKLYDGSSLGLTVKSTLLGSAGVNPSAMVYDWFNNVIYVGLDVGGSVMILRSNAPFTEWVDITYDHQTANGVNAIMVL